MDREKIWEFRTKQFCVICEVADDDHDDTNSDVEWWTDVHLATPTVVVRVSVYFHGEEIGEDELCGCLYTSARKFLAAHRDPDPLQRNSASLRAKYGANAFMIHYFPSLVRGAIKAARNTLARSPRH